jgi:hypothetical protein
LFEPVFEIRVFVDVPDEPEIREFFVNFKQLAQPDLAR